MAEQRKYDGRFGDTFDAELSVSGIVWSGVAILVCCILGIAITLGMWKAEIGAVEARDVSPLPRATERAKPAGPLLQASPEAELEQMRRDMADHLAAAAWVDRETGVARIPIDLAIAALAEQGVATELAGPALATAEESGGEPAGESGDVAAEEPAEDSEVSPGEDDEPAHEAGSVTADDGAGSADHG